MAHPVAPVFFGQEKEELEELNVSIIPASQSHSKCEICNEALEKYFDDEEDMWMVRGAVKVGEKVYYLGMLFAETACLLLGNFYSRLTTFYYSLDVS